ncbi:DUF4186 domain-containing protein [Acetobacter sp. TBRC 12305]|uniref:DUF4186 domain-containing protein n=1 Tax=Acetobacter garciniae TaxID=2817435 RepID=A0A939HMM9_9PROT|nr:DUF4186 domain-containing protein [Acetobacter garciniae]MBO1324423.1 DUF4186 domain-containing protein [Acetobacter garciniae]MBX0344112.1 DUF4186 domain-containing protein [Acetobacter garciniae]
MTVRQGDLFAPEPGKVVVPADLWDRLARSAFRSKFSLDQADRAYLRQKGLDTVMEHGRDFIARRLAPAQPARDGRQTPWKGHPIFVAQHATGTCCRSCLQKWHGLPKGRALDPAEQQQVLAALAEWLRRELRKHP